MRTGQEIKEQVNKVFGNVKLTGEQIWLVIKILKFVRLRCRNNAALNNVLNTVFGGQFRFSEENKQRPKRFGAPGEMENYKGLVIRNSITNEKVTSSSESEEEE